MKEIQIIQSPLQTVDRQHIADMHSVINLLSVIASVLTLLESQVSRRNKELVDLFNEVVDIGQAIRSRDSVSYALKRIKASRPWVIRLVTKVVQETTGDEQAAAQHAYSNLLSIYEIARERVAELELRAEDPDLRVELDVEDMKRKFVRVFKAIEKNSLGAYRIQFNLALKEQQDYYFDLRIDSERRDRRLHLPLRFIDVLRDLTANSRKYTDPGGRIAMAMVQDDELIRCRIEDNGIGIPADELDKVVQYGYRATNALHKNTMGGGYGLSKAAWLILSWGGSLSIASELNKGTVFRITLPGL